VRGEVPTPSADRDVAVAERRHLWPTPLNARIAVRDGRFIKAWGRRGSGPGEFNLPHTLVIDSRGRLLVGDRSNNRIQIFDQDGAYLDQWTQFGTPSGMFVSPDDTLYVVDYNVKKAFHRQRE
jgi:DNA-binding beta-propeller fold protein YncE